MGLPYINATGKLKDLSTMLHGCPLTSLGSDLVSNRWLSPVNANSPSIAQFCVIPHLVCRLLSYYGRIRMYWPTVDNFLYCYILMDFSSRYLTALQKNLSQNLMLSLAHQLKVSAVMSC